MASDKVRELSDTNFKDEVVNSDKPTLVDFWAPWCMPCKAIAPVIEELAATYDGKVKFTKLNVDDNPMTASSYGVRGIPTLIFFKNGSVVDQIIGAVPKAELEKAIGRLL
jgi:thioredoxin 1